MVQVEHDYHIVSFEPSQCSAHSAPIRQTRERIDAGGFDQTIHAGSELQGAVSVHDKGRHTPFQQHAGGAVGRGAGYDWLALTKGKVNGQSVSVHPARWHHRSPQGGHQVDRYELGIGGAFDPEKGSSSAHEHLGRGKWASASLTGYL